jgi:hypothetical protein
MSKDNIIQFPERDSNKNAAIKKIELLQEQLSNLYESLERINKGYWRILTQTTEVHHSYQELLQDLSKLIGMENIPESLLKYAIILVDPETGEVLYTRDEY